MKRLRYWFYQLPPVFAWDIYQMMKHHNAGGVVFPDGKHVEWKASQKKGRS